MKKKLESRSADKYFNRCLPLFPDGRQKRGLMSRARARQWNGARIHAPANTFENVRGRSIKSREIPRPCHKGIASIRFIPVCPWQPAFYESFDRPARCRRARLLAFPVRSKRRIASRHCLSVVNRQATGARRGREKSFVETERIINDRAIIWESLTRFLT